MNQGKDVTEQVKIEERGDIVLLRRCVCGKEFDRWDAFLRTKEDATPCECGRKLYYEIRVYEVQP